MIKIYVSGLVSEGGNYSSREITTDEDIETVKYLSDYFKFDYQTLGRELLARGADVSDLTEEEIINLDSKAYMVNGYDIQIAVLNSVDVDSLLKKRKEKICLNKMKIAGIFCPLFLFLIRACSRACLIFFFKILLLRLTK